LPCDCSLAEQELIDILYIGIAGKKQPPISITSFITNIFLGIINICYIFAQRTTEIAEMLKRVGKTTNH
jgi:hypothetical protein